MYTPPPKDLTKFVINMSSQQASHTWMAGDSSRSARFGSSSNQNFDERRHIDQNRTQIAAYANSSIAHTATSMRGEIADMTRKRLEERQRRFGPESDKKLAQFGPKASNRWQDNKTYGGRSPQSLATLDRAHQQQTSPATPAINFYPEHNSRS
jgi:hypothetical protein